MNCVNIARAWIAQTKLDHSPIKMLPLANSFAQAVFNQPCLPLPPMERFCQGCEAPPKAACPCQERDIGVPTQYYQSSSPR